MVEAMTGFFSFCTPEEKEIQSACELQVWGMHSTLAPTVLNGHALAVAFETILLIE